LMRSDFNVTAGRISETSGYLEKISASVSG
jgi:hypothetical protein